MRPLNRTRVKQQHVEIIGRYVAEQYGIRTSDLFGEARCKSLAEARAVAYWLARETTALSFPELGLAFARDHSTVLQTIKMLGHRMRGDAKLAARVRSIASALGLKVKVVA